MNKEERLRDLVEKWNKAAGLRDDSCKWCDGYCEALKGCADEPILAEPTPCATEERLPGERKVRVEWPDVPPSLNRVLRMHWAVKSKETVKWMNVLLQVPGGERRKLQDAAKAKQRVKMTITLHNARQFDRDNAYGAVKVVVDAIKAAGLIYDDRPAYLDLEVNQVKSTRKAKKTVIELEILEPRGK